MLPYVKGAVRGSRAKKSLHVKSLQKSLHEDVYIHQLECEDNEEDVYMYID